MEDFGNGKSAPSPLLQRTIRTQMMVVLMFSQLYTLDPGVASVGSLWQAEGGYLYLNCHKSIENFSDKEVYIPKHEFLFMQSQ